MQTDGLRCCGLFAKKEKATPDALEAWPRGAGGEQRQQTHRAAAERFCRISIAQRHRHREKSVLRMVFDRGDRQLILIRPARLISGDRHGASYWPRSASHPVIR